MQTALLRLCAAIAVLFVTGCAAPESKNFPSITFGHLPAIDLGVANKSIASAFQSSSALPRVELEMPVIPENTLRQWAIDRISPTGGTTASLTFTIVDASVTASALETDKDLKAWFTDEQAVRYAVSLKAKVSVDDPAAGAQGVAEAEARRSVTVHEKATVNERDQILFDLIGAAAADFDRTLEANIRKHLAAWVR